MKRIISVIAIMMITIPTVAMATDVDIEPGANATCDNDTLESIGDPVSLRAEWEPHTINLKYYNGGDTPYTTNTCEYGGGITLPDAPNKPGYEFVGWRLKQCSLSSYLPDDDEQSDWDSEHVRWKPISNNGYTMANYGWTENSSDLPAGGWAVLFSTGEIKGRALCSTTPGEWATVGTPVETGGGQYCWCAGTSFGDSCSVSSPAWVFYNDYGSADNCTYICVYHCAHSVNARSISEFRRAVFGAAGD